MKEESARASGRCPPWNEQVLLMSHGLCQSFPFPQHWGSMSASIFPFIQVLLTGNITSHCRPVVLNQGWSWPSGDIWQCLETFGVTLTWVRGATDTWWVEGRKAAKHPTMQRTATPQNSTAKNYVTQSREEVEKPALGFELPPSKQVSRS